MAYQKRYNKYGNVKQTYGGRSYDSKKEAAWAMELDWRKKAGEVRSWTPQYKLELYINGTHWRNYHIDFRVECTDGSVEYIEVKGFPTREWKQKWDVTVILFQELTSGENAKLYLNDKLIKETFA